MTDTPSLPRPRPQPFLRACRAYVSSPTPAPPAEQPPLYLRRNLGQRAREGPDAELVAVLRTVSIFNGLECKISCATSKVRRACGEEGQRVVWRGVVW